MEPVKSVIPSQRWDPSVQFLILWGPPAIKLLAASLLTLLLLGIVMWISNMSPCEKVLNTQGG